MYQVHHAAGKEKRPQWLEGFNFLGPAPTTKKGAKDVSTSPAEAAVFVFGWEAELKTAWRVPTAGGDKDCSVRVSGNDRLGKFR